ncbi:hypothetical protein DD563_11280 [Pelagicola sp. LXJ1103]|nr:hypothetical protein DD563_11280 [Pelagicola sp. LXJ1103]
MLRDASVESCATSCSAEDIAQLTEVSNTFSHIVINIDAFDSVDRAVDTLMTFRTSFPTVRVLMVSSVVLNDDLGGHRKQVGDVTLRAPVSSERLKIALQAADANNRDWTASITPSQSEPCLQFPRSTYPEGLPG